MNAEPALPRMAKRFRCFLPVVVDVETGGFDCTRHALLEIAAAPIEMDDDGRLSPGEIITTHVEPFAGSEIDPKSLEVTGIDIGHPFRDAKPERAANRGAEHDRQGTGEAGRRSHRGVVHSNGGRVGPCERGPTPMARARTVRGGWHDVARRGQ